MIRKFFNTPVGDGSLTRKESWKYFLWWIRPHFHHRPYGYTHFYWGSFGIYHERRYYRTSGLFLAYESFNMKHEREWKIFDYTQPEHKRRKLDGLNTQEMNNGI